MGKSIKGFLIAACVCILTGIIILIGVTVSGGADVVAEALKGGVYFSEDGFHVGGSMVFEDTADMEFDEGKNMEFAAGDIKNLDIELAAGTFEIVEGDEDKIIIRSAKKIRASQSGNTLKIDTGKGVKVHFFGISDEGNHVEITLPKGKEFHTIDLEIGAGTMNVDTLVGEDLELEIGAGEIIVDELACEKAKISVGAGKAVIDNGIAEELDLDVGMGEIWYAGSLAGDLDADCGMGNMDVRLDAKEEDYDYKIDVGMGNITVGNASYGGMAQSKEIDNDADSEMDLDCGMGNIKVHF